MLQSISSTEVTPLARVNGDKPGQILKNLDAGCYGIICPMVSNKKRQKICLIVMSISSQRIQKFWTNKRFNLYGGSNYAKS